jgi:hypothetical protein
VGGWYTRQHGIYLLVTAVEQTTLLLTATDDVACHTMLDLALRMSLEPDYITLSVKRTEGAPEQLSEVYVCI